MFDGPKRAGTKFDYTDQLNLTRFFGRSQGLAGKNYKEQLTTKEP